MHESVSVPRYVLDLDGETIEVGNRFWVAMRVRQVPADETRPHGLEYAFTLHSPRDGRIIGYDNAHSPPLRGSGPARRSRHPKAFDHVHKGGTIRPYEFTSIVHTLEDFWRDVEAVLAEAQGGPS